MNTPFPPGAPGKEEGGAAEEEPPPPPVPALSVTLSTLILDILLEFF